MVIYKDTHYDERIVILTIRVAISERLIWSLCRKNKAYENLINIIHSPLYINRCESFTSKSKTIKQKLISKLIISIRKSLIAFWST